MNVASAFDERDFIRRIQEGDAFAFETLFRAHFARLCDFANSIVAAPDIAQEIVQDVFAHLWSQRRTLSINSTLRGYLYAAVRNRSLNQRKRSAYEVPLNPQLEAAAPDASAHTMLESAEIRARVRAALHALPPRNREVLELRWLHGLAHAEIADALAISRKAVEQHLARGLAALREQLGSLFL